MTVDKKKLVKNIGLVILSALVFFSGYKLYLSDKKNLKRDIGIEEDHPLLIKFKEEFPDKEVLLCGLEDLNADSRKDLLVLFVDTEDTNGMVALLDNEDGVKITDKSRAPIDNQEIKYLNIDDEDPMEFIVSGSKNGVYGYAIFRIEDDHRIKDIFGEGMNECC